MTREHRPPSGGRSKVRGGDPQPILDVLNAALARSGLARQLARYRFVTHWPQIVGEEVARRTRPEALHNGSLVIRVSSSVWAQELGFQKELVLARLQQFLDSKEVVNDVRFYVADIPGRPPTESASPRRDRHR
jgi:predicted nucleic acid-binding Zn ribbon protein